MAGTSRSTGNEGEGPQLSHASSAVEDEQHQDRDEQTEDPGQVSHVAGDDDRICAAELASGRRGDSHGAEADVDGVTDDGHDSGLYSWGYLYELASGYATMWLDYLRRLEEAGASRHPAAQVNTTIKGKKCPH